VSNLYYNEFRLGLSGREYEILETYSDGTKKIQFPTMGGEVVLASPKDLDESYKEACETRLEDERQRIIRERNGFPEIEELGKRTEKAIEKKLKELDEKYDKEFDEWLDKRGLSLVDGVVIKKRNPVN